jgi:predicted DNA-binding mobile mystery protein A
MQIFVDLIALHYKDFMINIDKDFQSRLSIDSRLGEMRLAAENLQTPRSGWLKAIRQSLGMSSTALAKKLGIGVSSVSRMEQSEVDKTIKLETLQKVAEQLDCDVVYALVPRQELEKTIYERALQIANEHAVETQKSMSLEGQRIDAWALEKLIAKQAQELIGSKSLWNFELANTDGGEQEKRG